MPSAFSNKNSIYCGCLKVCGKLERTDSTFLSLSPARVPGKVACAKSSSPCRAGKEACLMLAEGPLAGHVPSPALICIYLISAELALHREATEVSDVMGQAFRAPPYLVSDQPLTPQPCLLAWQVLYYLSHAPSIFCFSVF
jgi:hypothetical protein